MPVRYIQGIYLADTATVLGELTLGPDVNIWHGASVRGDVAPITIGAGTNVQDGAVIHCDKGFPNIIGANVIIAHHAVCHGEAIGDGSMIGIGAKVLGHTKIGKGCIVAAGAVVPPGMEVPDGMVVMGIPAKIARPTNDKEKAYLAAIPPRYIEVARLHAQHPDDPRVRRWGD